MASAVVAMSACVVSFPSCSLLSSSKEARSLGTSLKQQKNAAVPSMPYISSARLAASSPNFRQRVLFGTSGAGRQLRISAAEESQTAAPETVPSGGAEDPKSTIEIAPETVPSGGAEDLKESTIEIVRQVIAKQLAIPLAQVEAQTNFADLGADSLDTVEIMMALEEKFGVSIEDESAESLASVKDAADLIEQVKKGPK